MVNVSESLIIHEVVPWLVPRNHGTILSILIGLLSRLAKVFSKGVEVVKASRLNICLKGFKFFYKSMFLEITWLLAIVAYRYIFDKVV